MTRRRDVGCAPARLSSLARWRGLLLFAVVSGCEPAPDHTKTPAGAGKAPVPPADVRAAPAHPARFSLGRVATGGEQAAWDLDVNSSGKGLPPGSGTHAGGAAIYAQKCASCHGPRGEGMGSPPVVYPKLIGREPREGFPFGRDLAHVKTVGNYWPYATTIYDYLRRSMPLTAPGSLTSEELYGLTAFLLAENEIIDKAAVMDARTLPAVRMPARDRFVRDARQDARPTQ